MTLVPGYKSLFGESQKTYEQWLEFLPSDIVISIVIMFNH